MITAPVVSLDGDFFNGIGSHVNELGDIGRIFWMAESMEPDGRAIHPLVINNDGSAYIERNEKTKTIPLTTAKRMMPSLGLLRRSMSPDRHF